MDHTVLLVLLLAFCTTAGALDSEGTNFVFAFVRNANAGNISNQVLSATVLNQNALDCKFTLTYRPDYHKSTPAENITQTVLSMNAIVVDIPQWYGWNYAGQNVQDDVYLTLTGYSTCPVTVIANNIDSQTGQGDSYMVLPTTWGSRSFTFSLPPAVLSADQQYEQVFILPTTDGVTRVNVAEIGNAQSMYSFNVTYGNAPAVYIGARTPDKRPRTYHVTSDKDVLIVAGVTCAGADVNTCDHVAYMPHPPPTSDCYPYDYYDDDHMSYLPTTSQFFTDIPGTCLVGQNITSTLNDGVSQTMTIKPQMESPLWTPKTTSASQLGVSFHNGGSNIHVARYYDGTKFNSLGAFIATSTSVTQYHNARTSFFTRNANDTLELYCNVLACASITVDGTQIKITDTQVVQKVDGVSYYMFLITIPNPGFHLINLNDRGEYAFFVFGKNKQYSYGYEGGCNKPTFVLAPPTTTIPQRTTTPGPSTATVSTQSTLTPPTTLPPQTTATPLPTSSTASPQTPVTMTPPPSTATTVVTVPAATTQTVPITVTTATPGQSTVTTAPVVITTQTIVTAPTTATTAPVTVATAPTTVTTAPVTVATVPTTVSTAVPVVTTATTNVPVVTTVTTKPPVVSTQTTQAAPTQPPQTSSPTVPTTSVLTTASPSTVGSTVTVPTTGPVTTVTVPQPSNPTTTTVAPPPVTTPTTTAAPPPVTTRTTAAPPPVTTTTTVKPALTTTTKATQAPVTTPTTAAPVTTPSTAPVTVPVTTKSTTTTTTTTTTQTPSTSTQSSSMVSIALPIVLTFLFALSQF